MFKSESIIEYKDKQGMTQSIDFNNFAEVLISANPVFDWLGDNITTISFKLLKGFITNIIPLENEGRKYFEKIATKRTGFIKELWELYNQAEKRYYQGKLKITSYIELEHLGYTGVFLDGRCPFDDVTKYLDKKH